MKIVGFDGYYSKESSILHAAALELKIIVFVKTPKNSSEGVILSSNSRELRSLATWGQMGKIA